MSIRFARGIAATALFALAGVASAADTIATDRPGFPFSSLSVRPGSVQLEASTVWESGNGDERTSTPTLLRIGLAPKWELRLSSAGRLHDSASGAEGWGDLTIGIKRHLAATPTGASVAWLAQVDLATGDGAPGRDARPSVGVVAEWTLAQGRSLAFAHGLAMERDVSGRGVVGSAGVLFGQPVGQRSRLYAELAAPRIAIGANGKPTVIAGFGGSHLLRDDLQVDIGYSAGLSSIAPDHVVAIGLSHRW